MTRLRQLCAYLFKCRVFADVGCDHGHIAEYMLKNGLCERAIISDVSPKSLKKAEVLLSRYITAGKCSPVCCDGLKGVVGADCVFIAGLGGEEIIKILREGYLPEKFIFQPMKNAEKLRAYLLEEGCRLTRDDIFTDGKNYYFIICGERGISDFPYTPDQLNFGKDSLSNDIFKAYLNREITKFTALLQTARDGGAELNKKLNYLKEVLNDLNRTSESG